MKRLLLPLLVAACTKTAPVTPPSTGHALTGKLHVSAASSATSTRGRLAVAWLTADEAKAWRDGDVGGDLFRALIERFRVGPPVDLAAAPSYTIEAPPNAAPLVVVDVDATFWETLFGGGHGFVGLGSAGGGDVELKAAPPPKPKKEPCQGPRFELLEVSAPELAGSIHNSTQRRFCAYLPASYASSPDRRYPVVLLFGGFMSNEMARFRGRRNAAEVADEIFRETGQEALLVGVDASTTLGSSYLDDSPVTGRWDTWLSGPALAAIDGHFRTLGTRTSRGLIGQSTGGFLVMSFGFRHADAFGAIGATSPDALDLDVWTFDAPGHVKPWLQRWMGLERALGGPGQMTSYAADWSPGEWPFDLATGKTTPAFEKWQKRSPSRWLDEPRFADEIKEAYSGKIIISASTRDEFDLTDPAVAFSRKLAKLHIANELDLSLAGHLDGTPARTEQALRFVLSKLDKASGPEVMVVGTEHGGHVTEPGYPMSTLGSILEAYRPDLVLVEIRPEAFAAGRYEDGPIEMSYVTLVAKKHGVAVEPIDWWRDMDLGKKPPVFDRDGDELFEHDFGKEAEALDRYGTFEELNSPERARRWLAMRNAQTRLGAGEGVTWARRQAWFHHLAREAIAKHRARRVLAFVGFAHRPELEAYLVENGMHAHNPRVLPRKEATVPPEVVTFWREGAERLRKTKGFEKKAASWERAIQLRGGCCTKQ